MTDAPQAELRPLKPEDLEAVVDIDRRITGRSRRVFFEKRLEAALADVGGFIPMAVESDGRLSGFAIARLQNGEFGDARRVATLDVIGVDPERRHGGQGALLLDGILSVMGKRDVHELRTQVDWSEASLIGFFADYGFALAPRQVVERPTGQQPWEREVEDDDDFEITSQRFDAGIPDYSDPNGDDFEALSRDQMPIRSMAPADLEALIRIDRKLTGRDRRAYFTAKLREVMGESGIRVSLVAEVDGRPAGFIMARVDYGEFGRAEPAAVIDTIGVDPGLAHHGIGRALLSQLLLNLYNIRVETVRSTVLWDSFDLLGFLQEAGFAPAQQLVLTKAVA
jgi:ribosomal protein S18 acetylase RimI-like enzyme